MSDTPCRILIVDDCAEDRESYRRGLAHDGERNYEFFEASLGEEGLELCRKEVVDCVLLDYNLPDLNGLEFIERLRQQKDDVTVPVVMLTGQGNEAIAVEALKKGAQDYVAKKLAANNLANIVRAAIDRVALSRQLDDRSKEVQRLADERTLLIDQLQHQAVELKEADRRKDEFLAMLAHELRNPLGPIRNATNILGLPPTVDGGHAQARDVIERQVAHMGHLIDDLLDVSRIARGKILLRLSRIDLVALARLTAEDHRATIEMAGSRLTLDLPTASVWVDGDPTRLAQVIGNLLHNASKFTDPGGSITLAVHGSDESVSIVVSDTGIGMDASLLAHAFEAFNQAEQSLDRRHGGLGLGLALSKGLVELHGGHVKANSDGVGKGCSITVAIPRKRAPDRPTATPTPCKSSISRRVLVIEDNVDAAQTLSLLLRAFGHTSATAFSGIQGLQIAQDFHPEVVLCDIGLPGGMDGFAVARALRRDDKLQSAYLIAVTGYAQDEDIQQARAAGFDAHMTKPVDPKRLEQTIERLHVPSGLGSQSLTHSSGECIPRAS